MRRTKTTFRAMRETVGLSIQQTADMMGVCYDAIKRWEKPEKKDPPDDIFDRMEQMYQEHYVALDTAVQIVLDVYNETGERPDVITLPYWRTQEDYDALGRDPGLFTVVNARTRAVAQELTRLGFSVEFIDPTERGLEAL